MSVFEIYKGDGGAKFMRPIHTREEYLSSRNTDKQRQTLKTVREQDAIKKNQLVHELLFLDDSIFDATPAVTPLYTKGTVLFVYF